MVDAFTGIDPVDPVVDGQIGGVKITIKLGSNIKSSTYNDKSFIVENIGDKRIAAIYFDITDTLFRDTVFDPIGQAGDNGPVRGLKFSSIGGTGAFEPGSKEEVLVPFYGASGTEGYEGMLLTFDSNVDGGYNPGEIIQFGTDLDPNSIVGLPKKPVDINGNEPRLNSWDIGGVSGAELINAKVHVLFTDGTTAVGELMGDGSQGGSIAVASQASPNKQVTLTVNGIEAGGSGSYSQANVQVLVSGEAGDTARVVLVKGFIQPFDYVDPDGNPVNLSEKFIGSPFPANNAIQFQTVDVLLDGTEQDITSLFDFGSPGGNLAFPGDDKLPIGFVASIIDANQLPIGPVTEPIYLLHTDAGANTAPTTSGIADVTVTEGAANTVINLFDAFADAETQDDGLSYGITDNTTQALFDAVSINSATGELTLDYAATGIGSSDITVSATDPEGLSVETTFTVNVNEAAPPPPDGIIRIEAEDYIPGTNGVEYFDGTNSNLGGAYRPDEEVDIQVTKDEGGGFNVGWIKSDEFLTYSVNIPEAGVYDFVARVASKKSNAKTIQVSVDGQAVGRFKFTTTGGWQTWQDVILLGISLNAGVQEIRLDFLSNDINLNYVELIPSAPDKTLPTATLNSATLELPVNSTNDVLFTINYSDNVAIESDTLDGQDIQVTAPDGTLLTTSFVSVNPSGDSASSTATYVIAAPSGGWQTLDSGTYTVEILADQVLDTSGNPLASQQFNLGITVSDSPVTEGIPDLVVLEGASDSIVDLFVAFEDAQDADADLTYTVTSNTNPGLVSTTITSGDLTLDYGAAGTGSADITVEATDTDGGSTETTFTVTVVTPQADDGVIRINAGGGDVYDDEGHFFQADTYFIGGQADSVSASRAIANTKYDALYLTQRQGGSFSYSIPVANGNYILSAHIVDWESTDFGQRTFDIMVEGQSFYHELDIYSEIKNAFLEGKDTAKIIQGPDKNTTIVTNVPDGSFNIDFSASLNDATIAALEIVPLNQPGVLIQQTNDDTIVSEDGLVDSYVVVLTAPPTTGEVTVNLNFDNTQIGTNSTSLTFNATDWDQPQTINVTAVEDALVEGPHTEVISHTVSATVGSNYEGITTADSVTTNIIDNDSGSDISFTQKLITTHDQPTTAAFGSDGRLYVASVIGNITVYTLNDDYTIDESQTEVINIINNLSNNNITGIAFNPYDTVPRIYVSHNEFYANKGKAFPATEFSPYSGQVSILEKVNGTWELTPLVTGIGVSNHDHGVNGLAFDNNGDLYIAVGSNTNAGIADLALGGIDESPFTAAILKAEITKSDFNGNIEYSLISPDDLIQPVPQEFLNSLPPEIFNPPANLSFEPADSQFWGGYVDVVPGVDVSVYASGTRNPYDLVFTTQGLLYATDNNANGGFGDVSTGPYTQEPIGKEQPEELNLIVEGAYYGSPNRNRGRYDFRQNIFFSGSVDLPAEGYTAPITTFQGSTNGIIEYRATTFGSQLRGNLLAQKWKNQLYSIDLSSDGTQVDDLVNLNDVAEVIGGTTNGRVAQGLDVITGPGGAIVGVDYTRDELTVAIPNHPSVTDPTAYDIYPWRAPVTGGQSFIIGGVNFDADPGDTRVFIGDQEIFNLGVSETRIRGVLPDLSSQPNEILDVTIKDKSGSVVSMISEAFQTLIV